MLHPASLPSHESGLQLMRSLEPAPLMSLWNSIGGTKASNRLASSHLQAGTLYQLNISSARLLRSITALPC